MALGTRKATPVLPQLLKGAELCSGSLWPDTARFSQRRAAKRRGQTGEGAARRETLRDKLARKLEEHADEVVAAYLAGIRSDDPNRAYRAADAWISRVHGRPKETVENVTAFDDPLDVSKMTREERDRLKRSWLPSILTRRAPRACPRRRRRVIEHLCNAACLRRSVMGYPPPFVPRQRRAARGNQSGTSSLVQDSVARWGCVPAVPDLNRREGLRPEAGRGQAFWAQP